MEFPSSPPAWAQKQIFSLLMGLTIGYFLKSAECSGGIDADMKYLIALVTRIGCLGTLAFMVFLLVDGVKFLFNELKSLDISATNR